jgi:hypothetical protein
MNCEQTCPNCGQSVDRDDIGVCGADGCLEPACAYCLTCKEHTRRDRIDSEWQAKAMAAIAERDELRALVAVMARSECRAASVDVSHCGTLFPHHEDRWCRPCQARAALNRQGIRVEPKMGRLDWLKAEKKFEELRAMPAEAPSPGPDR